jgi:hypothetical protein
MNKPLSFLSPLLVSLIFAASACDGGEPMPTDGGVKTMDPNPCAAAGNELWGAWRSSFPFEPEGQPPETQTFDFTLNKDGTVSYQRIVDFKSEKAKYYKCHYAEKVSGTFVTKEYMEKGTLYRQIEFKLTLGTYSYTGCANPAVNTADTAISAASLAAWGSVFSRRFNVEQGKLLLFTSDATDMNLVFVRPGCSQTTMGLVSGAQDETAEDR